MNFARARARSLINQTLVIYRAVIREAVIGWRGKQIIQTIFFAFVSRRQVGPTGYRAGIGHYEWAFPFAKRRGCGTIKRLGWSGRERATVFRGPLIERNQVIAAFYPEKGSYIRCSATFYWSICRCYLAAGPLVYQSALQTARNRWITECSREFALLVMYYVM